MYQIAMFLLANTLEAPSYFYTGRSCGSNFLRPVISRVSVARFEAEHDCVEDVMLYGTTLLPIASNYVHRCEGEAAQAVALLGGLYQGF